MPSLNMPVQKLKVAFLPLDLPCSEPVTHSGEMLTTGKSQGKKLFHAYTDVRQKKNKNDYFTRQVMAFFEILSI